MGHRDLVVSIKERLAWRNRFDYIVGGESFPNPIIDVLGGSRPLKVKGAFSLHDDDKVSEMTRRLFRKPDRAAGDLI